jgi:hypothetical protein
MGMDWQVTATTLYCEAVADEVTLLVYPDWSVKCTGQEKYAGLHKAGAEQLKRRPAKKKSLDCQGINCPTVSAYLNKLKFEEEKNARRSGSVA